MNWGLFLALNGFLLPLAIIIRFSLALVTAGLPLRRPIQAYRGVVVFLLAPPVLSKAPAMLFAISGNPNDLAAMVVEFMVTGWGIAHLGVIVAAVLAIDLATPSIEMKLSDTPPVEPISSSRNLVRDAAIVAIVSLLAWVGAQ